MRFAENNRISHRQLYRQMILALLAPFMLCVFGKGGMNGISAVAGMIFALILLGFYVIWLIRLTPSFEDPVKSAGAFAGRMIGIFFLIYVLMAGGYLLALLRRLVEKNKFLASKEEQYRDVEKQVKEEEDRKYEKEKEIDALLEEMQDEAEQIV